MNPFEATRIGLIKGNIPEPLTFTTTKLSQSWLIRCVAGTVFVFDWGDGTANWYYATGGDQAVVHTYASAGTYSIKLHTDPVKVQVLYCNSNGLSGTLPNFAACTDLRKFYCYTNSLSGALPSFATCPLLTDFNCASNAFSGTLPSFASCTLLTDFQTHTNSFSGTFPSFATLSSVIYVWAYTNSFTGYAPGVAPLTLTNLRLEGSALTVTAVDAILADFATNVAARPAVGTILLNGGTNAAPSAAGVASRAAILAAKPGWTVTVNP